MAMSHEPGRFKGRHPIVYLDQWVWIELAAAAIGKKPASGPLLSEVGAAARAGVRFPLSDTHYFETQQIKDPRQRHDLAAVMTPLSRCRTLRHRRDLVKHQMLSAFHETFGRPAFRPAPPRSLGFGAFWAFAGSEAPLSMYQEGRTIPDAALSEEWRAALRRLRWQAEALILAGPEDGEVEDLRSYGYLPEAVVACTESRLSWEADYAFMLSEGSVSRHELRVRLQARELMHEYLDVFNEVISEYRLPFERLIGVDPERSRASRARMVALMDLIPTLRISVELKLEQFRNAQRGWTVNAIHDIDALSLAIPYCDVVVADRDAASLVRRAGAGERHGTIVLHSLSELLGELRKIREQLPEPARAADVDPIFAVGDHGIFDPRSLDPPSAELLMV